MGRTNQQGWSDPETDLLKILHADGLSCAEMAVKINEKFGTSYTRNAVIGRASRLGLIAKNRPGQSKSTKIKTPRERKPRFVIIGANGNTNRQRIIESVEGEVFKPRCVEIVPRNVSIFDLEPGDCRYPYGEGAEITFCGHSPLFERTVSVDAVGMEVRRISAYCTAHHFLCVGPGTYSERRADVVEKAAVA